MNGSAPEASAPTALREAVIDLGAIRANTAVLLERALAHGARELIAVVKAQAYGHGMVPVARAVLEAGAGRLGVADVQEAIELRDAGIDAPIVCWLLGDGGDLARAVERGIEIAVSSPAQLERLLRVGREAGRTPIAQFKLDTGLSRNGAAPEDWGALFRVAEEQVRAGRLIVAGVFSHLANASEADDEASASAFLDALDGARAAGLDPGLTHLSSTAATLARRGWGLDAVRVGIGLYGLSPFPGTAGAVFGLRPAMSLRARVAAVRRVTAGTGVSYDYAYRTTADTTLALIPLGYADGIPRAASDRAPVRIGDRTYRISGRVAMDQFVVDVGDDEVEVGQEAVLFGDPATGAPSADDWADACGTINYEIVTRIGPRVPRRYVGG